MSNVYDVQHIKIRPLHDDVIVYDMYFGEMKTAGGIILRSDDGKSHGVKPRWAKVYKVGPEQKEIKPEQWVLVEHGRWSRKVKIHDGQSEKEIQKVDLNAIMCVSDEPPTDGDVTIKDSGF